MQYYQFEITDARIKVTLRKKPREPIVLATVAGLAVEISIADNKIEVISGEVPPEMWEAFKKVVAQYFLPVKKKPE